MLHVASRTSLPVKVGWSYFGQPFQQTESYLCSSLDPIFSACNYLLEISVNTSESRPVQKAAAPLELQSNNSVLKYSADLVYIVWVGGASVLNPLLEHGVARQGEAPECPVGFGSVERAYGLQSLRTSTRRRMRSTVREDSR